jgi:hypothetical protein
MAHPAAAVDAPAVTANLNYLVPTGVKPVNETLAPGPGGLMRRVTGLFQEHPVSIRDGRMLRDDFTLDGCGFEFVERPTRMTDFFDPEELARVYYPETEQLIAARTGASRIHVFDHTLRSSDEAERVARKIREPFLSVHNDYTEWSGPQRVRDLLPDEADALLARRFAIVQVWRPLKTVQRDPLAIADARSLDAKDFVAAERRFPDRVGEIYQFQFNPHHCWYYFPQMKREEALVFKVYDSATDGRARWGAHTAFEDPSSDASAPARESIEVRALVFFGD